MPSLKSDSTKQPYNMANVLLCTVYHYVPTDSTPYFIGDTTYIPPHFSQPASLFPRSFFGHFLHMSHSLLHKTNFQST